MVSEDVHIYIGEPGARSTGDANADIGDRLRVTAQFGMQNETDKPIALFIGFPVPQFDPQKQDIYNFRVTVNDETKPRDIKTIVEAPYLPDGHAGYYTPFLPDGYARYYNPDPVWFGWDQTFPVGHTVIHVEYKIEAFHLRWELAWEHADYILATGACWKGRIGRADVTAHFGVPVAPEMIRPETGPAGYKIEGDGVHWRFTDWEPGRADNVRLVYMPLTTYYKLQGLRQDVRVHPQDESHVVRLAEYCFSLGNYLGVAGDWHPRPLSFKEYDAILARITDPNDKAAFEKFWENTGETTVWKDDLQWGVESAHLVPPEPRLRFYTPIYRIIHIMGSAGFLPRPLSEYETQAKEMLERLLEKNPKNADAWMAYLSNCHHFVYGAGVPGGRRWCPMAPEQKKIIERAYARCPTHEGIEAWHDFATSKAADTYGPEADAGIAELLARLKKVQSTAD